MSSTMPGGAKAEASGSGHLGAGARSAAGRFTSVRLVRSGAAGAAPWPAPEPATGPQPQAAEAAEEPVLAPSAGKVRLRRTRRFFRRPTVRVVSALIGVFVIWVGFSAGQAAFQNNGQGAAANLAEWARHHSWAPLSPSASGSPTTRRR